MTYIIKKFITLAQDMDKTVCETKAYSTESHVLGKKKGISLLVRARHKVYEQI